MDVYQQRKKDLKAKMDNPLPTPCVGEIVVWYHMGKVQDDNQVSAIVTKVEEPGKVTLTILRPNSMPIHKQGVHYIDDPRAEDRRKAMVVSNGLWGLRECDNLTKRYYEDHLSQLRRQMDAVEKEEKLHKTSVPELAPAE